MEQKKCLLIVNPISGTSNKRGIDKLVAEKLKPLNLTVETVWTTAHGDATKASLHAVKEGYDSVIVAGGDGTVNETAIALRDSGTKLGIIPCGSGNGLARHLEIPIDIDGSLEIIQKNCPTACDYGTVNDRPFFCTFGLGFDAEVSQLFATRKRRGPMSYFKSTIKKLKDYHSEEYIIWANGKKLTEKAFLIAVCNASQYGNNAYIAPNASLTDGMLDITIVHQGNPFATALVGIDLMTGYLDRNTLIHTIRVPSATIMRSRPGAAHIDGEPVMMEEKMEVTCHPQQLIIYTNPHHVKFRPIITPVKSMFDDINYALRRITRRKI